LPEYLKNSCLFYAGPAFYPDGKLSAIGPTTSLRMDSFATFLYSFGVAATLGKGPRTKEVVNACRHYTGVYLITYGGAAAYLTNFVKKIEVVEFAELGPEAIYRVLVENFPAVVGIDVLGNYIKGAVIE
jgi:fumarate hydratase subunit beta